MWALTLIAIAMVLLGLGFGIRHWLKRHIAWQVNERERTLRNELESLRAESIKQLEEVRGEERRLREELKNSDKTRRDYVANASHELRTPLTAIRGFAETLADGALEKPDVAQRFLKLIVDNAVRLERLIDDLLELSRSDSPESGFTLEPVDAVPVVKRLMHSFEGRAHEKKLSLELTQHPEAATALADERALEHIISNLIDNAIKYTQEGGQIRVSISLPPNIVRIDISDSGQGIDSAKLPRVFERFYRVDKGRSRDIGGTGLGLAIVKHLATRMQGDVTVDSALGRGSTFSVQLPKA